MKFWIKIFFFAFAALLLIFCATYIFIMFKGKAIIVKNLEDLTRRKVTMSYFDVVPPLNIKIMNLKIAGMANVEQIYIAPSIPHLLFGNIALNNVFITKPEVTFEKNLPAVVEPTTTSTDNLAVPAAPVRAAGAIPKKVKATAKPKPFRMIFQHLAIKDGKLNFIDQTVGPEGIKITVKDINFNLNNLFGFPRPAITNFDLRGSIPWHNDHAEGKIEAEGWLNFNKRDMQASLKITDIDGIHLYPYYSRWVDLEKARIESANLNFTSNINGLNNNVTAECHLELTDIVRKPRPEGESQQDAEKIADTVIDIFKALNEGKIALDFTIRTKMDRPEFGFTNIKMAVEDKLAKARGGFKVQDIFALPGKMLEGTVRGATGFSKSVISGTFAIGKELKDSVADTFGKPSPPPKPKAKVEAKPEAKTEPAAEKKE